MPTPTVQRLRRVLARALAATPLALACRSPTPPPAPPPLRPEPVPWDATVVSFAPPVDASVPDAMSVDASPPKSVCDHGGLSPTASCNMRVVLRDPPSVCGLPTDGPLSKHLCGVYCGGFDWNSCSIRDDYYRGWVIHCSAANPCYGRLPSDGKRPGGLGALELARRLEAESVIAFCELAADLARWGAPAALVRACRRAAREEARHAATMARLLRARGSTPERLPRRRPRGFDSLLALALHNEREGVVGETWGALAALNDAATAPDADVRAAMRSIASDELGHAALSFRIAAWTRARLPGATAALDAERAAAAARLPALHRELAPLWAA